MARKQRTGLSKAELHALADANSVEYTANTTNADLEDALEVVGVNLQSAEEAPPTGDDPPSSATVPPGADAAETESDRPASTEVELEGTPASSSGTRVVGEPVPSITSHAQPEPALAITAAPDAPQEQTATAGGNVAGATTQPATASPPASLTDVATDDLERAREVIDKALSARATSPAGDTGAPIDRAKDLPLYYEHTVALVDAAAKVGIAPEDVLANSVHVRQRVDNKREPYGEGWVTLVDVHGAKHAARL